MCFWTLRDTTHLLGDGGRTLLATIRSDPVLITEPGAQAINRIVVLFLSRFHIGPVAALEAWSCLLGMLGILVAIKLAALISPHRKHSIFAALILTTGTAQFWCGYIESYPLVYFLILLFLLLALAHLAGKVAFPWISLVLASAIATHVSAIFLLPAYVYVLVRECRRTGRARRLALLSAGGVPVVWIVVIAGLRPSGSSLTLTDALLAPLGDYGMLSPAHIRDFVNELMLVFPILIPLAVASATSLRHLPRTAKPQLSFLTLAAIVGIALAFAVDPKLGMARDWDLLACMLAPVIILLCMPVVVSDHVTPRASIVMLFSAFCCTAPWVLMNHDDAAAIQRFHSLLEVDNERPGVAYGYETLGVFLRDRGDKEGALSAFGNALKHRPGYKRYLAQLQAVSRSMPPEEAYRALVTILASDSTLVAIDLEVALIEAELGDTRTAVARLDRIIGEGNALRDAAIALARVHLEAHDYRAAISTLDAIEASGEAAKDGELHYLRGVALLYGGRSADAIVELELARRNLGSDSDVEFHLGLAHLQCKQIREARTFFSAYLSLNPDGRYAEMARDLMRE